MRRLLRYLFLRPVLWASAHYTSKPDRQRIFAALSQLLSNILSGKTEKGLVLPFDAATERFIIFSDMHKGAKNGADDFALCEAAYNTALDYYYADNYKLVALGDCEELWENSLTAVRKANALAFEKEKAFAARDGFIKIFGNHDLHWQNDPLAPFHLAEIYGAALPVYEGVLLQTIIGNKSLRIFCTHGHQGDAVSDGNWFSKFFISKLWAPFQSYLKLNPNTPAYNDQLKSAHNSIMYDWSAQEPDLLLITGHTHQPVFESLTHIERLYRQLLFARRQADNSMIVTLQQEIEIRRFQYKTVSEDYLKLKPTYFNSGCCCYDNGSITGIEISGGALRLVQWKAQAGTPERIILEEAALDELLQAQA